MSKKSFRNDQRDRFRFESIRLTNKGRRPAAPQRGSLELYFRDNRLYRMDEDGVETAIESLGISSAPNFLWSRFGTTNPGDYLLNEGQTSNKVGIFVFLKDPRMRKILISHSAPATCSYEIGEVTNGDVNTFVTLVTVNLTNERNKVFDVSKKVTSGKELAVRLKSGTAVDPIVAVLLDGVL